MAKTHSFAVTGPSRSALARRRKLCRSSLAENRHAVGGRARKTGMGVLTGSRSSPALRGSSPLDQNGALVFRRFRTIAKNGRRTNPPAGAAGGACRKSGRRRAGRARKTEGLLPEIRRAAAAGGKKDAAISRQSGQAGSGKRSEISRCAEESLRLAS